MTMATSANTASIAARIEAIPISGFHYRLAIPIGICFFFDAFDSVSIAYAMPGIIAAWKLTPAITGALISSGYAGQAIGAIVCGRLAERLGRTRVILGCLLLFSAMSLVLSITWSPVSLGTARFVQGMGLGGLIPVVATYCAEWIRARERGTFAVLYQSIFAIGIVASALSARWIIPHFGWHYLFLIGALPILLAPLIPAMMPESPRWLADRGRIDEADRVLESVERHVPLDRRPLPAADAMPQQAPNAAGEKGQINDLFRPGLRKRTFVLWCIWFCSAGILYGITTWTPSLMTSFYRVSQAEAINVGLQLAIVGAVGVLTTAMLIDRIGRRRLFMLAFSLTAIPMIILAVLQPSNYVVAGALISVAFFFISMFTALNTYAAELYPTRIRATGVGFGMAWLRIASTAMPIVIGLVLPIGGANAVFGIFAGAALLGLIVTALFAIETRNRTLESLSEGTAC